MNVEEVSVAWTISGGKRLSKKCHVPSKRLLSLIAEGEILIGGLLQTEHSSRAVVRSLSVTLGIVTLEGYGGSYPVREEYMHVTSAIEGPISLVPFFWQTSESVLSPAWHFENIKKCFENELMAARFGKFLDHRVILDIILDPWAGSQFIHEVVGHSLEADNFLSYTRGCGVDIGTKISELPICVFDDPSSGLNRGSYKYDDEGVLGQRVALIEKGVVTNVLTDKATAYLLGTTSNGHGRRIAKNSRILPRMSTTVLEAGSSTLSKLIGGIEAGLLCRGCWVGGSQGNTFMLRPTHGQLIKGGHLVNEFVRRFDLLGEKFETLRRVDGIGDDLAIFTPAFGCAKDGQDNLPIAAGAPHIRIRSANLRPI